MSDTDTTGTDQLKAEPQEDRQTLDRRELLKRGAITLGAAWLALGSARDLLASAMVPGAGDDVRAAIEQQQSNRERLDRAIRLMEKHIRKNSDGTFELTAKNAEEAGVDPEMFDQLRRSLEKGNEFVKESVKAGRLRADEVRATTGRPEDDAPGRSGPPGGR